MEIRFTKWKLKFNTDAQNGKLIAAAPEMFEALQLFTENVEEWLKSGIAADKETSEMIYNKAKLAIKKATE